MRNKMRGVLIFGLANFLLVCSVLQVVSSFCPLKLLIIVWKRTGAPVSGGPQKFLLESK